MGNKTRKLLKTIKQNYIKAPYFNEVYPILEKILNNEDKNLASFVGNSIQEISAYLKIEAKFKYSSELNYDNSLSAFGKVVAINKELNADKYINPIGGQKLYDKQLFADENIVLNFIQTEEISYQQFDDNFTPNLSIVDTMT